MTQSAGSERRQQPRRPLRNSAFIAFPDGRSIEVRAVDISVGGLAVVSEINLQTKSVHTIQIALPLKPKGIFSFKAEVEVMHSIFGGSEKGFKIGLRFTKVVAADYQAIIHYINAGA